LQPVIRIQDTPVALHKGAEADTRAVTVSVGEGNALVAPSASKSGWPQFVRQPAAHLILDRSAASAATEAETVQRAKAAISALPVSVQKVRVTWANYEQEDVSGSPETREVALGALDRTVSLPFRGGFCPERVIARLLLEERGKAEQQPAGPVPLFIVVPAPGSSPVKVGGLAAFTRFVPDMPAYIVCSSGGWEQASFGGGSAQPVSLPDLAPAPIMAVRKGKAVELLSAAAEGGLVLVPGEAGRGEWECWDPAQKTFRPIERLARCADPDYAAGLALWARHRALGWEPGSIDTALPGLVADAQAAGIAIPETAFVVVETSAQEVMLARKEKQSLGAGHALEFDEVKRAPAPPALWLLPVAFYLLYRRFRNTMSDCKSGNRQVSRA
ncbi:MAG: hypothetical protein HY343_00315, partial [Lentisphaerae bacterium]|nr:hypothetical protein [Lentisphaerota bacterium]